MSTERSFASFLDQSFDALRRQIPELHERMCQVLAPRDVELRIGDEVVALRFAPDDVAFVSPAAIGDDASAPRAAIEVVTARPVILALIDAETTILDAVLDERLGLRGSLEDLVRFHDGLRYYLHGAMRAPAFRDILERYRHA